MPDIPAEPLPPPRPVAPTLAQAARYWLRLGCISFGGPAGQIALMHAELVERRRWISEARFLHALNYCMLLPGPEAQQLATYLGWLLHRTAGGLVAGALFVLPSLALLVVLSWVYLRYDDVPWVAGALYGIKPAVTALVAHAAWRLGTRTLRSAPLAALALAAFAASLAALPFPLIVAAAALAGALGARWAPGAFAARPAHAAQAAAHAPALIDDDTPTPAHARWAPRRALAVAGVFVALWALALGALAWGAPPTLAAMGWFFTKAALLTFGGAYAVLPYVFQGAVGQHGWLSAAQMIDGLALGETTPGPLIMVVAFVGFVGGATRELLGAGTAFASGAVAAGAATFFTFLPSFAFILAGAPFIESTHGRPRLAAPLAGIGAAVVGVILALAVFFARHVLWPPGGFDAFAAALAALGLIALQRWQANVVLVIAACALAGMVLHAR